MRALLCLAIVITCATASLSAKRKDDRIVLSNGDHVVGEIKGLVQGELRFKTGYILDEFRVDWARVEELESQDQYRVEIRDGEHLIGTIARHAGGEFTVTVGGAVRTYQWTDIMYIAPIETSLWAQLTGQINSGFSYTSGDSQTQFSASGSVGYLADNYAFDLSGSSTFNSHSGDDPSSTSRNTADLLNEFTLTPGWFAVGLVDLLNSDQQDLELRTTLGGGVGRWLARTTHTRFATIGGLVYTHETYTTPIDPANPDVLSADNLEGLATLLYDYHRFKTTTIEAKLSIFPSLSALGRVRLGVAPTLNIEIAHNLYWNFTLYENYDSRPPVNANKNDFGITNSLGWKF